MFDEVLPESRVSHFSSTWRFALQILVRIRASMVEHMGRNSLDVSGAHLHTVCGGYASIWPAHPWQSFATDMSAYVEGTEEDTT